MGVENISFILFASEESKIHFEIPSTIGNARSKKFSNCTTTRLRWNSLKFLGTISYEISWSTNKTKFYTRKISIFSVDLFTEWGTRAIRTTLTRHFGRKQTRPLHTRMCPTRILVKNGPKKPQFFKIETCKTITRDFLTFDFKKDWKMITII